MSTLKITDEYLKTLADGQLLDLMRSMSGTNDKDSNGKNVIHHIYGFASGTGGLPDYGDDYTALLGGAKPFTDAVSLASGFTKFVGLIKGQLDSLGTSLQTLRDSAYDAQQTFNNADQDALDATQMFQVLSGSSGSPTGGPPTSKNGPST
ncbi:MULTISPECIES: hypothetical protein [Kitasatospora]|uniref:hypothetical protein n=1 Tax=Kitasatospora TaxID=2063 RepID=UPI000C7009DC|nr:hypothetical protein [Kitasatospora sp. GP30]MDH6143814.1 hypothetical protein [Kitasatospora sp. GP30]